MNAQPHRTVHPLAKPAVALAAMALALMAGGLPGSPAHAASNTPRAQYWEDAWFAGDKLDKDAPGYEADLTKLGRDCFIFGCVGNWNDQISSLDTRGGGQPGAWTVVWQHTLYQGRCLVVPAGVYIRDLNQIRSYTPQGWLIYDSWGDYISSLQTFPYQPAGFSGCNRFAYSLV